MIAFTHCKAVYRHLLALLYIGSLSVTVLVDYLNYRKIKRQKKKFKAYSIGYFHIDIAEVSTEEGKLYLFVAIDRTSKFAYVELLQKYGKMEAAQFLRNLIKTVPYKPHTILTDNGIQFTNRVIDKHAFTHVFDRVCHENNIEHRLDLSKSPLD